MAEDYRFPKRAVSIAPQRRLAIADDARLRKQLKKQGAQIITTDAKGKITEDSFQNFSANLGIGTNNIMSASGYGFNPITRIRTLLEWVHRGSWLGGKAVDVPADDMTREGVELKGDLSPDNIAKIEGAVTQLGIWKKLCSTIKWSRLYGGCIGVYLIDGQDPSTPLRIETVGKGAFHGIIVLDRWMVDPSPRLVTKPGPQMGLPEYYTVNSDAPGLRNARVHYTRCIRMAGIELPYWQSVMENLWGCSVIERIYDRMVAFDSATTGAAQLVYKAYIRTYKIKGLREVAAAGGPAMRGVVAYVEMMRKFQGLEGVTLMDLDDEFEGLDTGTSFTGLSDALTQFGQQLSGALEIPLVRLFGQSPSGFNSGDADLKNYYDGIAKEQERDLREGVTTIYRLVAQSEGIKLKDSFSLDFRSLWQMSEKEKAETAQIITTAVSEANSSGLISDKVAAEELKHSSETTGVYSNISQEDINGMSEEAVPKAGMLAAGVGPDGEPLNPEANAEGGDDIPGGDEGEEKPAATARKKPKPAVEKKQTKDDAGIDAVAGMKRFHDLDIVIENPKDSHRQGFNWDVIMPACYGFIRRTKGADGMELDCIVGPNPASGLVVCINQRAMERDGDTNSRIAEPHRFDEHKFLFGYEGVPRALADYLASYSDNVGFKRIGGVRFMQMDEFKTWKETADTTKPFGDFN